MNETIFVLGLGETLRFFKDHNAPKIGVNDIWSKVKTEMVVCIDRPEKFTDQRMKTIEHSTPKIFYSYLDDWRKTKKNSHYWKAPTKSITKGEVFKEGVIYHSLNSPFVACNIAYLIGAKNIVMYGVDFMSHPKLKGASAMEKITKDFTWLRDNLAKRGVKMYVGHSASRLSGILPVWPHKTDLYSQQVKPSEDIATLQST